VQRAPELASNPSAPSIKTTLLAFSTLCASLLLLSITKTSNENLRKSIPSTTNLQLSVLDIQAPKISRAIIESSEIQ
jgi:hypothetical protein